MTRRPTSRPAPLSDPQAALTPQPAVPKPVDPKQEPIVSLAKINTTLRGQTKQINKQLDVADKQLEVADKAAGDIHSTKEAIVELLKQQQTSFDTLESRRERPEVGGSGTPGGIAPPSIARPSTNESDGVSSLQNLMNNILGSVIGNNLSFQKAGAAALGGFLGRTVKWGVVGFALDEAMNMALEGFDITPEMAAEIRGDGQRAIGAGITAKFLGLKGKYALVAAAVGYMYEDISAMVDRLALQEGVVKDTIDTLDKATGGYGTEVVKTGATVGTGILALAALNRAKAAGGILFRGAQNLVTKGAPIVANAAWAGLKNTAQAGRAAIPSVLSAVKSKAGAAYRTGMQAVAHAGATGIVPLAATAGTLALLSKSVYDYKQMLADYPQLAPMNNGQGPGLVLGRYLIDNNLIDQAIEEQKRKGTYNNRPKRETTQEVPTIDPRTGSILPPGLTTGIDPSAILNYLDNTAKTSPIVPGSNPVGKPITMAPPPPSAPQVVVVPVPTPAPSGGGKSGGSSTAIISPPVSSVDHLDLYDRVIRSN